MVDMTPFPPEPSTIGQRFQAGAKLLRQVLEEPIFTGVFRTAFSVAALQLGFKLKREDNMERSPSGYLWQKDESIGDFLISQGFDRELINNTVGAMMHGIYCGDMWQLSVEGSMFHKARILERWKREEGKSPVAVHDFWFAAHLIDENAHLYSVANNKQGTAPWRQKPSMLAAARQLAERVHAISFRGGFGTLTHALAYALAKDKMVTIKTGEPVTAVRRDWDQDKVQVK